jgi:hypothetical protein
MRTTRSQAAARIVPPQGELIGQGLVRSGVLSSANVEQILVIQRRDDERLFGEIAVDLGYTADSTISEYLESRRKVGVLV